MNPLVTAARETPSAAAWATFALVALLGAATT
jgi:hypothetical protein